MLARTRDGMVKTRMVYGDDWMLRFFPSDEEMRAFADAYGFLVVERSKEQEDDEGDNG